MSAGRVMSALSRPSRRDLLVAGALLTAEAVTFARMPWLPVVALANGKLEDIIPTDVGAWYDSGSGGLVLPPEQQAKSDRVYSDVLARSYLNPNGASVMLLVAYDPSQSGMLQVHRPEACYPAAGFDLSRSSRVSVPLAAGITVPALFLTATNGPRVEQVLYWTRIGRAFPRSYDEQRSSVMNQNLQGLLPDGALVRISMLDDDAGRALSTLAGFARTLFAKGAADCRKMLIGPPAAG